MKCATCTSEIGEGARFEPITVTLEQTKKTKGTYRFDYPNPDARITSIYARKSAFEGGAVPKPIVLMLQEGEGSVKSNP